MHLPFIVILLGVLGLRSPAVDAPMRDMEWANQPVSSMAKDFERITDRPAPSNEKLRAVYCEDRKEWWGHLRVFKQSGDKVEWVARLPAEGPTGRGLDIESFRWVELSSTSNPVLEIFGNTHRGNGYYWILELVGREFRVLLNTKAGGEHPDLPPALAAKIHPLGGAIFRGNLEIAYGRKQDSPEFDRFRPKPGPEQITFRGKVILRGPQEQNLSEHPYEEKWIWDTKRRVFLKEK